MLNIEGFSMGKLKEKSREFVKIAISIGQDNYPEIMSKMYIVNAPFMFKGAWAVISPFIDAKTKKKISILGSGYQKDLFKYVDPSNVPVELGGDCTCSDHPKGCFFSDKGPWNEYPGDEVGEAAKQQLAEEEKKELAEPVPMPVEHEESKAEGVPDLSKKQLEEIQKEMDKLKVDPTMKSKETESLKVHQSDSDDTCKENISS